MIIYVRSISWNNHVKYDDIQHTVIQNGVSFWMER